MRFWAALFAMHSILSSSPRRPGSGHSQPSKQLVTRARTESRPLQTGRKLAYCKTLASQADGVAAPQDGARLVRELFCTCSSPAVTPASSNLATHVAAALQARRAPQCRRLGARCVFPGRHQLVVRARGRQSHAFENCAKKYCRVARGARRRVFSVARCGLRESRAASRRARSMPRVVPAVESRARDRSTAKSDHGRIPDALPPVHG